MCSSSSACRPGDDVGAIRQPASSLLSFTGPYLGKASKRCATVAVCASAGAVALPSVGRPASLLAAMAPVTLLGLGTSFAGGYSSDPLFDLR